METSQHSVLACCGPGGRAEKRTVTLEFIPVPALDLELRLFSKTTSIVEILPRPGENPRHDSVDLFQHLFEITAQTTEYCCCRCHNSSMSCADDAAVVKDPYNNKYFLQSSSRCFKMSACCRSGSLYGRGMVDHFSCERKLKGGLKEALKGELQGGLKKGL